MKKNNLESIKRRLQRSPRGQAIVEYSTVTFALLIGTTVALLPGLTIFYKAVNTFYDSIYFILESAVP